MGLATFQVGDIDLLVQRSQVAAALGYMPRNVYFVNSNTGATTNVGNQPNAPLTTLALALAKCESNKGDVVVAMAGHAETLGTTTAGLTFSQSGVALLGCGDGASKPQITCGAAQIPGVLLSGSNNRIQNIAFIASSSQTSSSWIFSVTGTGNTFKWNDFSHGVTQRCISMTGATRTRFIENTFLGTAAGADVGIYMTSACANSEFVRNIFNYQGSSGLDSAAVFGSAGVAHAGLIFDGNIGLCMDLNLFDINGSHASISLGDSLMCNNYSVGSAAQTIASTIDGGGAQVAFNWLSDALATGAISTGVISAASSVAQRIPAGSPCT